MSSRAQKIPKALANDNFVGYAHAYIVENSVTWLEATIACPVFSGLITYYIEGDPSQRGHMMESPLGQPQRAWAVRGNIFSFLLPWEKVMSQLSKSFQQGDFTQWPLDQDTACEIVRVRFHRGQESLLNKFKELKVRSQVVKQMAKIYIENYIQDLGDRPHVLKLCSPNTGSLKQRLEHHIEKTSGHGVSTFGVWICRR